MKPLSDAERAKVAQNVSQVKALMPELVPVIKELHELGMIRGWRDVAYIGPIRPEPAGPNVVRGDQMVTEPMAVTKERMKRGHH